MIKFLKIFTWILVCTFYLAVGLPLAKEVYMNLSSSAFSDHGKIPVKFTMPGAGGSNISPSLTWTPPPEGTKSLALVVVDPHPVARNWIHWVVIDIPPTVNGLTEGASGSSMPDGARELINSFGRHGYGGPQPPPNTGDHPYVFTLYALDLPSLNLPERVSLKEIHKAIKGHILTETSITGYFGRQTANIP